MKLLTTFFSLSFVFFAQGCKTAKKNNVSQAKEALGDTAGCCLTGNITTKQLEDHEKAVENKLPHRYYEIKLPEHEADWVITGQTYWPNKDCDDLKKAQDNDESPNQGIQKKYADKFGFKYCKANTTKTLTGRCLIGLSCAQPIVAKGNDRFISILADFDYDSAPGGIYCKDAAQSIKSIDGKPVSIVTTESDEEFYDFFGKVNKTDSKVSHHGCRFKVTMGQ